MGDKRPSVRTLSDGYKVRHYPATEAYPEGRMMMLANQSSLTQRLEASANGDLARQQELDAVMQERITVKQAEQKRLGLPPEKSHC